MLLGEYDSVMSLITAELKKTGREDPVVFGSLF